MLFSLWCKRKNFCQTCMGFNIAVVYTYIAVARVACFSSPIFFFFCSGPGPPSFHLSPYSKSPFFQPRYSLYYYLTLSFSLPFFYLLFRTGERIESERKRLQGEGEKVFVHRACGPSWYRSICLLCRALLKHHKEESESTWKACARTWELGWGLGRGGMFV